VADRGRFDAFSEWNGARKVMKKGEHGRVSFTPDQNFLAGNANCHSMSATRDSRVNALDAISRASMKQTLKRVVEVQYTTGMEVTG
jgi:hypothetical protein